MLVADSGVKGLFYYLLLPTYSITGGAVIRAGLHNISLYSSRSVHNLFLYLPLDLKFQRRRGVKIRQTLSRHETKFVQFNSRLCTACWNCIEACLKQVIGKVDIVFHRHARLNNPQDCNGCKACVRVCSSGALQYTYVPKRQAEVS
jgi:2-oxoglutarate ferredoxin oxidoreductase subunit delta